MRKSEEYRLHAVNCLTLAQHRADPGSKAALLAQARSWFALADRADRNSPLNLVCETPRPEQQQVAQQQQQVQPDKEPEE
jgi:hypothetical protein